MKDLNPGLKENRLMNVKVSSVIGFACIIIPSAFLSGIFMKYWVGITFDSFTALEEIVTLLDKNPALKWVTPLMFIGLPFIGACLNIFAITRVRKDKVLKEFLITVKYKLLNIAIIFVSLLIVAIFIFHAISGYINHTA
jgi:hypothetical protein